MRTALGTIQQTLTPEAGSVLTRSVEEAARRKHGQTTPLHVAATLLGSPSGLLRRACVGSHPDSAHPLRCRALDLCFSIALDRLPSSSLRGADDGDGPAAEPPMSNSLKAALKRAQTQQRRGCPEQQQTPIVAVKVELEQLVVSILDDPSVSRVMREARFSSVAVKAALERSLSSSSASAGPSSTSPSPVSSPFSPSSVGFVLGHNLRTRTGAALAGNPYMNPRLHQHHLNGGVATGSDAPKVIAVLLKSKKRNPVLVGDSDSNAVVKQVLHMIQSGDAPPPLHSAKVVSFFSEPEMAAAAAISNLFRIPTRIRELRSYIDAEITRGHGVVLDLGDLKWLVEIPGGASTDAARFQQVISEVGCVAVEEVRKLLKSFEESGRLWIVGTATCPTYLRCQVYHPTLENDWDVQVVHVAPGSSPILPSSGVAGALPEGFRQITATATTKAEKTSSLPRWLELAKLGNGGRTSSIQAKEENWQDTCSSLQVPAPELPVPLSAFSPHPPLESKKTSSQNLFVHQPRLNQEKINLHPSCEQPKSSTKSPVKTDLVLWNEKTHKDRIEALTERVQDELANKQRAKLAGISDVDAFKRLLKGLTDEVGWQQEAASAIATVVTQCKRERRKRPSGSSRGDTWLLFLGPDKVGKRKLAAALSETLLRTSPTIVSFRDASRSDGGDGESNLTTSRGRTSMDRVAEAIRRNPSSVVVLEDIDQADEVVKGSIKRSIERGRLLGSCGREVSLGSVIFILTSIWLPKELKSSSHDSLAEREEKILRTASHGGQLEFSAERKRSADWLRDGGQRPTKLRKPSSSSCSAGLSLDLNLNLAVEVEDEAGEGSSDLTTEHEHDKGRLALTNRSSTSCSASGLIDLVDAAIMFKPVDFATLISNVKDSISSKFASIMGTRCSIKIDEEVVDQIVGGIWLAGAAPDEWAESVLIPNLKQLKHDMGEDDGVAIVRLSAAKGGRADSSGDCQCLPAKIAIVVQGV